MHHPRTATAQLRRGEHLPVHEVQMEGPPCRVLCRPRRGQNTLSSGMRKIWLALCSPCKGLRYISMVLSAGSVDWAWDRICRTRQGASVSAAHTHRSNQGLRCATGGFGEVAVPPGGPPLFFFWLVGARGGASAAKRARTFWFGLDPTQPGHINVVKGWRPGCCPVAAVLPRKKARPSPLHVTYESNKRLVVGLRSAGVGGCWITVPSGPTTLTSWRSVSSCHPTLLLHSRPAGLSPRVPPRLGRGGQQTT